MDEESSSQIRLVTIQSASSLIGMLMSSWEKNKGICEGALRAQSHQVASVVWVEDRKKNKLQVSRLIPFICRFVAVDQPNSQNMYVVFTMQTKVL